MRDQFDEQIDRRDHNSAKWSPEFIGCGDGERIPFWVADTDFRAPEAVNRALKACVEHGIYGYTMPPARCAAAAADWQRRRNGFAVEPEWITFIAGIDCALSTAVQAYTAPGDKILINSPIYTPFYEVLERNGRCMADSPLVLEDGAYRFDWEDFERKAAECRLWMFCDPQNPSSRSFTREELERAGEICLRHGVTILSDEIHGDIVYDGRRHTPIASLSDALRDATITCTSPSKTFSVAGLAASVIIIPDGARRAAFRDVMARNNINTNILGLVAMEAAYENGDEYADRLVEYLQANRDYAVEFFRRRIPAIRPIVPEATFLLWLDCTGLGLPREELEGFFTGAGVRLSGGTAYLEPTGQFARLNFGCCRETLRLGLERIERAANALKA